MIPVYFFNVLKFIKNIVIFRVDELIQTSFEKHSSTQVCLTKQLKTAEKETSTNKTTNKGTQSSIQCIDNYKKGVATNTCSKIKLTKNKKITNSAIYPEDNVKYIKNKRDQGTNTERGRKKLKNNNKSSKSMFGDNLFY